MAFAEDDLLPISALQHLLFCERQCALIHIEGLWAENRLTVEGRHLHERAHAERTGPRGGGRAESRWRRTGERAGEEPPSAGSSTQSVGGVTAPVRIVRGLSLACYRLGLVGKADVVEFRGDPPVPFPLEYKRGRPRRGLMDKVQLAAQALCLEEMLGVAVPAGAIFYASTRRRLDVPIDAALRAATENAAARLRAMISSGVTPRARREKKCDRCSLLNLCLPDGTGPERSASRYTARAVAASIDEQAGDP
ncbi:MAG: CRISPR-associated protein Cas4 [Phycisphaerales bacterium]|nr:CRISPR-associated protein Cas4 [Phycisphaerales bacterium]